MNSGDSTAARAHLASFYSASSAPLRFLSIQLHLTVGRCSSPQTSRSGQQVHYDVLVGSQVERAGTSRSVPLLVVLEGREPYLTG